MAYINHTTTVAYAPSMSAFSTTGFSAYGPGNGTGFSAYGPGNGFSSKVNAAMPSFSFASPSVLAYTPPPQVQLASMGNVNSWPSTHVTQSPTQFFTTQPQSQYLSAQNLSMMAYAPQARPVFSQAPTLDHTLSQTLMLLSQSLSNITANIGQSYASQAMHYGPAPVGKPMHYGPPLHASNNGFQLNFGRPFQGPKLNNQMAPQYIDNNIKKEVGDWRIFDTPDDLFVRTTGDKYEFIVGWVDQKNQELVLNRVWGDPHMQTHRVKLSELNGKSITDAGVLDDLVKNAKWSKNRDFNEGVLISASGAKIDIDTKKLEHRLTVSTGLNITINKPNLNYTYILSDIDSKKEGRSETYKTAHKSREYDAGNPDGPAVFFNDQSVNVLRGDGSTVEWKAGSQLENLLKDPEGAAKFEFNTLKGRPVLPPQSYHYAPPHTGVYDMAARGYQAPVNAPVAAAPAPTQFSTQPAPFSLAPQSNSNNYIMQLLMQIQQLTSLLTSMIGGGISNQASYSFAPYSFGMQQNTGFGFSPVNTALGLQPASGFGFSSGLGLQAMTGLSYGPPAISQPMMGALYAPTAMQPSGYSGYAAPNSGPSLGQQFLATDRRAPLIPLYTDIDKNGFQTVQEIGQIASLNLETISRNATTVGDIFFGNTPIDSHHAQGNLRFYG